MPRNVISHTTPTSFGLPLTSLHSSVAGSTRETYSASAKYLKTSAWGFAISMSRMIRMVALRSAYSRRVSGGKQVGFECLRGSERALLAFPALRGRRLTHRFLSARSEHDGNSA